MEENKDQNHLEKVMIIASKSNLTDVYPPLVLANGARMEGIEADLFFTFFGLEIITKKRMDNITVATVGNPGMHMPTVLGGIPGMSWMATKMMKSQMEKIDIPPVREFLEIIKASGGKIFACKLAMDMFKLTREDLWEDVDEVLTVGQFYNRATLHSEIIFT